MLDSPGSAQGPRLWSPFMGASTTLYTSVTYITNQWRLHGAHSLCLDVHTCPLISEILPVALNHRGAAPDAHPAKNGQKQKVPGAKSPPSAVFKPEVLRSCYSCTDSRAEKISCGWAGGVGSLFLCPCVLLRPTSNCMRSAMLERSRCFSVYRLECEHCQETLPDIHTARGQISEHPVTQAS